MTPPNLVPRALAEPRPGRDTFSSQYRPHPSRLEGRNYSRPTPPGLYRAREGEDRDLARRAVADARHAGHRPDLPASSIDQEPVTAREAARGETSVPASAGAVRAFDSGARPEHRRGRPGVHTPPSSLSSREMISKGEVCLLQTDARPARARSPSRSGATTLDGAGTPIEATTISTRTDCPYRNDDRSAAITVQHTGTPPVTLSEAAPVATSAVERELAGEPGHGAAARAARLRGLAGVQVATANGASADLRKVSGGAGKGNPWVRDFFLGRPRGAP